MGKDVINQLLGLTPVQPETRQVRLPRLGLTVTLRELSYDTIVKCRKEEEASLHYLLSSAAEPDFRDAAWYRERMGCPTPVEAMKKLLRAGEIEALCHAADKLNGYGGGAVLSMEETEDSLTEQAVSAALEELEKN